MRRTTNSDPAFAAMVAALDAELLDTYGAAQEDYAQYNVLVTDTAVVALDGERPVACGCFKPFDAERVELKRVFTTPSHRGTGIARAIVTELETWARELGYRHIVLETGTRQAAAIAMYERMGYARIPLYGPYVGLQFSICMAKPLT